MKYYLRAALIFAGIACLLSSLVWFRYQVLYKSHLKLHQATLKGTYEGIVNTFQRVSQTIAEEVLMQEDVTRLVHAVVTSQGEERNHYRGLLFRRLEPLYRRVSQHSVRLLHFHFPDSHSMLRLHAPEKADDDLAPFRRSVVIANQQKREVHGYETGKLFHGFRHVYPLSYQGEPIGSVEISNAFQQIYKELIKHAVSEGSQYHFLILKSDLWFKLSAGQKEMHHPSMISSDYVCENSLVESYNRLGGTVMVTSEMRLLQQHLSRQPEVIEGLASQEGFCFTTPWKGSPYTVMFISIKNIDGQHAAYVLNVQPEEHLKSLQTNVKIQFGLAVLFAAVLTIFQMKLSRSREAEQRTKNFLYRLTEYMGEGLYATDRQGNITFINSEASRLLGYSETECLGHSAHDLFHLNDSQHQDQGCPILNAILNNETCEQQQSHFLLKSGSEIPVELTCTPIAEQGKLTGTITLFHDISQRYKQDKELDEAQNRLKKANRHLEKLANIDGLTNIANRRLFEMSIQQYWKVACRNQSSLSILLMDIDHFKAYNDTYGHLQGDECLRIVAEVIQSSCLRPEDVVARYGGEEFVALLPDTSLVDACHIAERICRNLQQQKIAHCGSPTAEHVTLSIGVCSIQPDREVDSQTLLDCADRRLYQAKEAGRNRICSRDSKLPRSKPIDLLG